MFFAVIYCKKNHRIISHTREAMFRSSRRDAVFAMLKKALLRCSKWGYQQEGVPRHAVQALLGFALFDAV